MYVLTTSDFCVLLLTPSESSDDEDDMLEGSLLRRRIISTHEAKIRELLEDEEDDFISEGIRALDIRSPTTTFESREIAPGEFYGSSKKKEMPPSGTEETIFLEKPLAEEEGEKCDEANEKDETYDKNEKTSITEKA